MKVKLEIQQADERCKQILAQFYPCATCTLPGFCEQLNGCLQSSKFIICERR